MTLQDVHIASGPGGGSGTQSDPWLADTSARFDEILRGIAEGSHIRIGAGTFSTLGLGHTIGSEVFGWDVRSHWTITGAGEAATIIRLERWPDFISSADGPDQCRRWAVVGCPPQAPVAGVVIEHLTVDANRSGLPNRPAPTETLPATTEPFVALHGFQCVQDGPITHRNVKVTGFYGKSDDRPSEYGDPPQPRVPLADLTQPGSAVCACEPSLSSAESNTAPVVTIENCIFVGCVDHGLASAVF